MKLRIAALSMIAAFLLVFMIAPADTASAAKKTSPKTVPITGTTATGQAFAAQFTINKFVTDGNHIDAVGTVHDVTLDGVSVPGTQAVTVPVQSIDGHSLSATSGAAATGAAATGAAATGAAATDALATDPATADALAADPASCTILDLVLGPLHLNLLGLVVDLNQVHLSITAVQGAGNLLGNLLCAVANLLNGTGLNLTPITNLLNNILAAL